MIPDGPSQLAMAFRLLQSDGVLAAFPGPALLVGDGLECLAANPPAAAIRRQLEARAPRLKELISRARFEPALAVIGFAGGAGAEEDFVIELTALPVDGGAAVLLLGRDASLDHNLRGALVDSRQRYKDLVDIASDFAWETGADGRFVFVSPRGGLGWRADQLVGQDPRSLSPDSAEVEVHLPFDTREAVEGVEVWFRRVDGQPALLRVDAAPLLANDGRWQGARGVARDITEQHRRDAALARARARESLLAYITRAVRDEIDPGRMLAAAASALARALGAAGAAIHRRQGEGYGPAISFGRLPEPPAFEPLLARMDETDGIVELGLEGGYVLATRTFHHRAPNGVVWLWRAPGDVAWRAEDSAMLADAASQLGIAIEQITNHELLERLSSTDELTGLVNRRTFFARLARRREAALAGRQPGALAYVDLDNFKLVNDSFGHARGDAVLRAVTALLRANSRPDDLVARLGGDEFALWLDATDASGAQRWAERLLDRSGALGAYSADAARPLGLSIGIAAFDPGGAEPVEGLIARADGAMYDVKRRGKGGFAVAPDPSPDLAGAAEG
jgi:diguanylate cyclase (GGDEF)-like protein/PAS domain S-box-containing protein